jgi:peptide deformylase
MRRLHQTVLLFLCTFLTEWGLVFAMENPLPTYIILDDPHEKNVQVLRTPAKLLTFPLSAADKEDIQTLIAKYDQEESCVGLAAPQIGISKRFVFVNIPSDPKLKKWRPDLTDTMERTVLINPRYEPLEEEKDTAYEGCFSVKKVTGQVARYTSIRYSAWTPEGQEITGTVSGFLARVLQHEIDHLNGQCFVDHVVGELLPMEDYIKMRAEKMEK